MIVQYTKANLEAQLAQAQRAVENAERLLAAAQHPDFPLAKSYGEEVRKNHVNKNARERDFYKARVEELQAKISNAA